MKLSAITAKTPLVKDFVARLAKSAKQAIPIVEIEKTKRLAGATVRPVLMVLENGQEARIYLRLAGEGDKLDIYRIDLNTKQIPISGDFDNSYKPSFNLSVDAIAAMITSGQKAFTAKMAKTKTKAAPKTGSAPKNIAQQHKEALEQSADLDKVIAAKTKEKEQLTEQLDKIINP